MSAVSPAPTRPAASRASRPSLSPSGAAFGGLLALGAILVLIETSGLSFFGDEWDYLLDRRGSSPHVLLAPHGPHLSLVPILIYKVLLHVFGASSYLPFRLLAALDLVIVALMLGIACRKWWGRWWGLAPVLLFVTLGPAGITLLWPFQCGYAIAVAAGLLSLLALGRGTIRGDGVACGALVLSLASASQGIGFVVGAAVMLLIRGDWRRRWWVVLIPAVLYALWYLKYGHQASESHPSLWKSSLQYSAQALSATFGALVGLSSISPQSGLLDITFGVPLAIAAVAALAVVTARGWCPPPPFFGAAATLVVIWVAASLSNAPSIPRPPTDPRYLSSDAALLMGCLCSALPHPRLNRTGVVVAVIALVIVAATNASQYTQARTTIHAATVASRAELGALEIMRGVVAPQFGPEEPGLPGVLVNVTAAPFFKGVDDFGLTADSPQSIQSASENTRELADRVIQRGESIVLSPSAAAAPVGPHASRIIAGTARAVGGCLVLGTGPVAIAAPAGQYQLKAATKSPLSAAMGRFAASYDISIGSLAPGHVGTVSVPSDGSPQVPWRMSLSGSDGRVCALGG